MESISIQIPASVYVAIYERYQEETSATITDWLSSRLKSEKNSMSASDQSRLRYPRPSPGTKTGRVWDIADQIKAELGHASREAVIKVCIDEGLNVNTASTQYSYWKSSRS